MSDEELIRINADLSRLYAEGKRWLARCDDLNTAGVEQAKQIKSLRDALCICRNALFIEDEQKHAYAIEEADKVLHETKPKGVVWSD